MPPRSGLVQLLSQLFRVVRLNFSIAHYPIFLTREFLQWSQRVVKGPGIIVATNAESCFRILRPTRLIARF
jgi:hypothetical protein